MIGYVTFNKSIIHKQIKTPQHGLAFLKTPQFTIKDYFYYL